MTATLRRRAAAVVPPTSPNRNDTYSELQTASSAREQPSRSPKAARAAGDAFARAPESSRRLGRKVAAIAGRTSTPRNLESFVAFA